MLGLQFAALFRRKVSTALRSEVRGSDFFVQIRAREDSFAVSLIRLLPVYSAVQQNLAEQIIALQIERVIGAGEGIRTLDPDLGKVVLYP